MCYKKRGAAHVAVLRFGDLRNPKLIGCGYKMISEVITICNHYVNVRATRTIKVYSSLFTAERLNAGWILFVAFAREYLQEDIFTRGNRGRIRVFCFACEAIHLDAERHDYISSKWKWYGCYWDWSWQSFLICSDRFLSNAPALMGCLWDGPIPVLSTALPLYQNIGYTVCNIVFRCVCVCEFSLISHEDMHRCSGCGQGRMDN